MDGDIGRTGGNGKDAADHAKPVTPGRSKRAGAARQAEMPELSREESHEATIASGCSRPRAQHDSNAETPAVGAKWSCGNSCERRLQTLAVLTINWPSSLMAGLAVMVLCLWYGGFVRYMMVGYVIWIVFIDDQPQKGDRYWPWLRQKTAPMYAWIRDYFPVKLIKTAELDPAGKYLFGYHPHGILSVGAFINFGSEANGFSRLFPGISVRLLTLASNMLVPFHREWSMAHGAAVASRDCCMYNLKKGRSVLLVLGGAQESLDAQEGVMNLTLMKRKGFVRIALSTGADLVPVLSFGENDVLTQWQGEGGWARRIQDFLKGVVGFAPPCPKGRGIWHLDGMDVASLPHRRAITTVVGAPIAVEKIQGTPTQQQIRETHEKYVEALAALFYEFAPQHAPGVELNFVA